MHSMIATMNLYLPAAVQMTSATGVGYEEVQFQRVACPAFRDWLDKLMQLLSLDQTHRIVACTDVLTPHTRLVTHGVAGPSGP